MSKTTQIIFTERECAQLSNLFWDGKINRITDLTEKEMEVIYDKFWMALLEFGDPIMKNLKIKFLTHNDITEINGSGTSLQGYINANYFFLIDVFGDPMPGDGYKTDAEWLVKFEDGVIATIYNYKDGKNYLKEDGLEPAEISEWHVGGKDKMALIKIDRLLEEYRGKND